MYYIEDEPQNGDDVYDYAYTLRNSLSLIDSPERTLPQDKAIVKDSSANWRRRGSALGRSPGF